MANRAAAATPANAASDVELLKTAAMPAKRELFIETWPAATSRVR